MVMQQDELFDVLFNKDDVTWQSMIYELVKKEEMNPWDIDIAKLAQRFLETLKKLKEMDFRISGKIILAAAVLLRLKSYKLVSEDLGELDKLIAMSEQTEQEFYDELEHNYDDSNVRINIEGEDMTLVPRTPQPRKRKVSVYDLVEALQKALEVKKRRMARIRGEDIQMEVPKKVVDIGLLIQQTYNQVAAHFMQKKELTKMSFTELINNSDCREEKIFAFVPLLHLSTHRKIDIEQEAHLSEIYISLSDVHLKLEEQRSSEKKEHAENMISESAEGREKEKKVKKERKKKLNIANQDETNKISIDESKNKLNNDAVDNAVNDVAVSVVVEGNNNNNVAVDNAFKLEEKEQNFDNDKSEILQNDIDSSDENLSDK